MKLGGGAYGRVCRLHTYLLDPVSSVAIAVQCYNNNIRLIGLSWRHDESLNRRGPRGNVSREPCARRWHILTVRFSLTSAVIVCSENESLMKNTRSEKEFLTNESAETRLINHAQVVGFSHDSDVKAIKTGFTGTYTGYVLIII